MLFFICIYIESYYITTSYLSLHFLLIYIVIIFLYQFIIILQIFRFDSVGKQLKSNQFSEVKCCFSMKPSYIGHPDYLNINYIDHSGT